MADLFDNPLGLDGFEFVEFFAWKRAFSNPCSKKPWVSRLIAPSRSKDVPVVAPGLYQPDRQL